MILLTGRSTGKPTVIEVLAVKSIPTTNENTRNCDLYITTTIRVTYAACQLSNIRLAYRFGFDYFQQFCVIFYYIDPNIAAIMLTTKKKH